ncbi:MAG: hypothetical protein HOP11_08215 [Saprospiraceae bacterium]|nr:hypothetical protein [Saprospiraceae bacterium]
MTDREIQIHILDQLQSIKSDLALLKIRLNEGSELISSGEAAKVFDKSRSFFNKLINKHPEIIDPEAKGRRRIIKSKLENLLFN